MPQGKQPSWAMKEIIWDFCAKLGPKPECIQREIDKLVWEDARILNESIPHPRTILKVIKELQTLSQSIVKDLPQHVQELRNDWPQIQHAREADSPPQSDLEEPKHVSAQATMETPSDSRLVKHFEDLARIAAILAHRLLVLINDSGGKIEGYDIVGGLCPWPRLDYEEPAIDGISVREPLDVDLAGDLLAHLNQDYPELALGSWEATARNGAKRQLLRKRLSLLARSGAFKPCSQCEVCRTLEGA